jgi:hypothetical protein
MMFLDNWYVAAMDQFGGVKMEAPTSKVPYNPRLTKLVGAFISSIFCMDSQLINALSCRFS